MDAAPPPENPTKSRRYRLAALALAGLLGAAFAILVAASIVIELFANPTRRAAGARPDVELQLECNREVRQLLDDLVREASGIELMPLEPMTRIDELATRWDRFGQAWDEAWRAAEERCRFDTFADRGVGVAYDRTAWVHRSLPTTKLKYAEKMARYTQDLAAEVAEMRRALDKGHEDLVQRRGSLPETSKDEAR